jgi:hypothetical protein
MARLPSASCMAFVCCIARCTVIAACMPCGVRAMWNVICRTAATSARCMPCDVCITAAPLYVCGTPVVSMLYARCMYAVRPLYLCCMPVVCMRYARCMYVVCPLYVCGAPVCMLYARCMYAVRLPHRCDCEWFGCSVHCTYTAAGSDSMPKVRSLFSTACSNSPVPVQMWQRRAPSRSR